MNLRWYTQHEGHVIFPLKGRSRRDFRPTGSAGFKFGSTTSCI